MAVRAALERRLEEVEESSLRTGKARQELGAVMTRAAQELGMVLNPNAMPAEHLSTMMVTGRNLI